MSLARRALVPALRAETPVQPGRTAAACEEWKRVRRHDCRVLVRLTRPGPLWDGIAAGSERWMEKLAQLQAYDRPVFTHVPGSFSTSAGGDTVTVNQYDSSCTALAGHTTARMRRGVHCAQFRIKSAGSEVDPNMPRVGIVQADTRTEGGYCASDTPYGWGWATGGTVWHNVKPWGRRLKEPHRWGEGDVLALRLDMDAGVLAGRVNGFDGLLEYVNVAAFQ